MFTLENRSLRPTPPSTVLVGFISLADRMLSPISIILEQLLAKEGKPEAGGSSRVHFTDNDICISEKKCWRAFHQISKVSQNQTTEMARMLK